MKPWTREDTQHWIGQLENRIEDIEYYVHQTLEWCEEREVYNPHIIVSCLIITTLWVAHMRNEPISKREIFEIIGVEDWYNAPEESYELQEKYHGCELEDLLNHALDQLS